MSILQPLFHAPSPALHGSSYPWPFLNSTSSSLTFAKGEYNPGEGRDAPYSEALPLLLPRGGIESRDFYWGGAERKEGWSLTFGKGALGYDGQLAANWVWRGRMKGRGAGLAEDKCPA